MAYSRFFTTSDLFGDEIKKDYDQYLQNPKDAITLLYDSLYSGEKINIQNFITRMQISNLCYFDSKDLKSFKDWEKSDDYFMRASVASDSVPLSNNGLYSCYSLAEIGSSSKLKFPLFDSFTSSAKTFKVKHYPKFQNFESLLKKLGVKIIYTANDTEQISYLKKRMSLFGKKDKFNIKIIIKNNIGQYIVTDQEKTVAILEKLFDTIISNSISLAKNGFDKVSNEEKCIAVIFSIILMNRALDYGETKENLTVERCLNLQLCNKLNALNLSSDKLIDLFSMATKSVELLMGNLGISLDEIIRTVQSKGFVYVCPPKTILEALTNYYSNEEYVKLFKLGGRFEANELGRDASVQSSACVALIATNNNGGGSNNSSSRVQLNQRVARRKTIDKKIDEIILNKIYDKISKLTERLNRDISENKKKIIKKQIQSLQGFVTNYYLLSKNRFSEKSCENETIDRLQRLIVKMKEDIIDDIFQEQSSVVKEKKVNATTIINESCSKIYNIKSLGLCIGSLLNSTLKQVENSARQEELQG